MIDEANLISTSDQLNQNIPPKKKLRNNENPNEFNKNGI